ncbi:hypothetical protein [Pelagibius sp.]|uniref:hypothetical protein n=1 Tax=Pelagibius sp. TaxID=1931238 RepID=UPI0026193DA7|nr:hypothetical protein [Pelagibius sp.]
MLWTFEDLLRRAIAAPANPDRAPIRTLTSLLVRLGGKTGRPGAQPSVGWRRDPLTHPALQAMSQRELGDLPFDPGALAED